MASALALYAFLDGSKLAEDAHELALVAKLQEMVVRMLQGEIMPGEFTQNGLFCC